MEATVGTNLLIIMTNHDESFMTKIILVDNLMIKIENQLFKVAIPNTQLAVQEKRNEEAPIANAKRLRQGKF